MQHFIFDKLEYAMFRSPCRCDVPLQTFKGRAKCADSFTEEPPVLLSAFKLRPVLQLCLDPKSLPFLMLYQGAGGDYFVPEENSKTIKN